MKDSEYVQPPSGERVKRLVMDHPLIGPMLIFKFLDFRWPNDPTGRLPYCSGDAWMNVGNYREKYPCASRPPCRRHS